MMDELEEKSGESLDLGRYAALIRRRWWYFLLPLFFGWALVWGASWVLPPKYKSSTQILVEQPTMPKDYVTPNVNDDLQDRLQSIQQQILSRTRLWHIIEQFNLYASERSHRTPEEIVERMRKDIEVSLVMGESQREVSAFVVAYSSRDPKVAQEVTTELTNLFINENLETRQQESEDTTAFLTSQLEEARKALAEQEEKVRVFKDQHPGALPTELQSNIQIMNGLQTQMQSDQDALNAARQQNAYLQSLLTQYHGLQKSGVTPGGAPGGLTAIDQELAKEQAQLADLKARYTDRYPDVRKMQQQVDDTQKLRAQMLANLKAQPSGEDAGQDDAASKEDTTVAQLQGQLRANQLEIKNREKTIADLQARIGTYQSHLTQEPIVEQQFADLTRGYEQSKANYDDLLKKKNASQMATSLELRQQGEHFSVLDPPSLPLKPDFPNRLKFCLAGLGIGLALGVISAGGAEYLDDRLHDEASLKKLLPANVIAEIPPLTTPDEQLADARKLHLAWLSGIAVGMVMLVGSALSYWRG
jgi:succinoglycan biosynthesis transport protein ExoP